MGKVRTRQRPVIESIQKRFTRDEHQICATPTCKNVIATWTKHRYCSRCRTSN